MWGGALSPVHAAQVYRATGRSTSPPPRQKSGASAPRKARKGHGFSRAVKVRLPSFPRFGTSRASVGKCIGSPSGEVQPLPRTGPSFKPSTRFLESSSARVPSVDRGAPGSHKLKLAFLLRGSISHVRCEPRFCAQERKTGACQRPDGLSLVTVPALEEFVHYESTILTRRFPNDFSS